MKMWGILGTGGHAKVVANILRRRNAKTIIDFYDVDDEVPENINLALGMGNFKVRKSLMLQYGEKRFPYIVDPSAICEGAIGYGTVVCPMAYIGPGSVIGHGCIINTKASIDHDCNIGNFVNINPGVILCGTVAVNSSLYISAGTIVLNNQTVTGNIKGKLLSDGTAS